MRMRTTVLAASIGAVIAASALGQEGLTNADVVKMLKAGLSEQIVLATIGGQPANFDISPDQLIELKKQGVSDSIIAAMAKKDSGNGGAATPAPPARELVLSDGTDLRVRLRDPLSSKTAKVDDPIYFEVAEDVKIDGVTAIAQGSLARGTIIEANKGKSFGRRGKLNFSIDVVKAVDGQNVRLRATKEIKGDDRYATAGVVSVLILPAGLFIKGKNVELAAGTEYLIYINGDRTIKIPPAGAPQEVSSAPSTASQ